jgi:hypothetical protein
LIHRHVVLTRRPVQPDFKLPSGMPILLSMSSFHLIVTRFTLCSPSFLEDLVLLVLRLNIHQTWKVCFRSHTVGRIAVASWPRTLLSTEINGSTPVLQDNLRNSYSQMDSGFDISICPLPINDERFVESVFFVVVLRLPRPLLLIIFLYAKCLMFLKRCIKTGNFHQVDQVCIIISVPLEIFKSELSFLLFCDILHAYCSSSEPPYTGLTCKTSCASGEPYLFPRCRSYKTLMTGFSWDRRMGNALSNE